MGKGGDLLDGCGWSCGDQEGVDAEAGEEGTDVQGDIVGG